MLCFFCLLDINIQCSNTSDRFTGAQSKQHSIFMSDSQPK